MSKTSFLNLLSRYQSNTCTETEKKMVEEWYDMLGQDYDQQLSDLELNAMHNRIWENVTPQVKTVKLSSRWKYISIAASIIILLVSGILFLANYNNSERYFKKAVSYSSLSTYKNNTDKTVELVLSDLSVVTLNPGARIEYPSHFAGAKREVFLNGDAFFKISHNPQKPFYVHNKDIIVKVFGTSFYIKETEKSAEVAVKNGKVMVKENIHASLLGQKTNYPKVLITANQMVAFDKEDKKLQTSIIEKPLPLYEAYDLPKPTNSIESQKFYDTPLDKVFAMISKTYGIEIKLTNDELKKCTFTGDISNKELKEQLNLICQSISGTYATEQTTIYIKGGTCN
ncbi:FecR family protein [Pedobacter sp. SL55]|uniref:FecR family protein n=1 Tax=Pedobacter sp. SL55 TaxID=2995161 RepID=UPI002271FC46|nr:FecR family protein [Pedobacter sp. SL55]WAC39160.1 FecR family protein [Pedobacter sp. SL55]